MSKLRKTILIIGILIVAVAASLGTALALYATGSMKTDPIELVYTIDPEERIYDGTPLKAETYSLTSGKLAGGHTAKVELLGAQTNVGTSMSDATVRIYDENGFNVTSDYSIKVIGAPLTVYKKSISVELPSQKVVYNGSKVLFNEYKISEDSEGDLCSGHRIYGSTDAALINVGDTLPDDLTPLIFDVAGNDVTENYNIEDFKFDGIEVIKRTVTVRPVSYEKVYDGRKLYADEIEFIDGTLVGGQTCEFVINDGYKDSISDVDEIETEISALYIYDRVDGEKVEVTDNYEVIFEEGYLKVTPRPLTVTAKSATFVYNGSEQSLMDDTEALGVEGLVAGEELKGVHYSGSRTDVGVTENEIVSVDLPNDGKNYDKRFISGTIEITHYEMTLKTNSAEKYYDGEPLSDADAEYELANTGHKVVNGSVPSITNFGEISNEYKVTVVDTHNGNADCTENYSITYEYGTLTVKKLPVKVTLESGDDREKVNYDSTAHTPTLTNSDYFTVEPMLPEGEEVTMNLTAEDFEVVAETRAMCNVGEYYYSVKFRDKNQEERRKYSNYELFVPENGVLEVTPLPVTVTLKKYADDNAFTYSGKAVKIDVDDAINIALKSGVTLPVGVTLGNLLTKENFSVVADEIIDAGDDYTYAVKIADSSVAKNFDVTLSDGKATVENANVTVKPMPVTVTLKDAERTYNGETQSVDVTETVVKIEKTTPLSEDDDVTETGLAVSSLTVVYNLKDRVNATDYIYRVEIPAEKKKTKNNYELTFKSENDNNRNYALLKVAKFALEVTTDTPDLTYNGKNQSSGVFTNGELANKEHTIVLATEVNSLPAVCNVTDVKENSFDVKILNGTDEVTDNYDIDYDYGKLSVKPCPLTIYTNDKTGVYNGEPLTYKSIKGVSDDLISGHTVAVNAALSSQTDVGTTENVLDCDVLSGGRSVKGNYDIEYVNGTLEVTPCPITLKTGSAERVYNGKPVYNNAVTIVEAALKSKYEAREKIEEGETRFSITDAGKAENKFACAIYTKTGNVDVSRNFEISFAEDCGTLTVKPLTISFLLDDFSDGRYVDMTYDGKQKTFEVGQAVRIAVGGYDYAIGERITDTEITFKETDFEITYSAAVIDAGNYSYTVDFTDETFKNNFTVIEAEKQMTCPVRVKKKKIEIQLNDFTGENALTKDALTFNNSVQTLEISEAVAHIYDEYSDEITDVKLLSRADLAVVYPEVILNAGTYIYKVKIEDDVFAKNFLYIEPEAKVTVNQFNVYVTLRNFTADYSGAEFVFPDNAATVLSVKLNDTQNVTDVIKPSDFAFAAEDGESIINVGEYTYGAALKDEIKARNFAVIATAKTVEIQQLGVNINLTPVELIFNGKEQSIDGTSLETDTPLLTAKDFDLKVKQGNDVVPLLKSGDYTYEAELLNDNFYLLDFDDGIATGGIITVKQYEFTITLTDVSKVYDGEEFDLSPQKSTVIIDGKEYTHYQSFIASVGTDLFTEEDFVLAYDDTLTDHSGWGEYALKAGFAEEYADFDDDVVIEIVNGTATVSKRTVTLTTQTKSFEYSGSAQSAPEAQINGGVAGHYAKVVENKTVKVTDVSEGEVLNKAEYRIYRTVENEGGEIEQDVTDNYIIDEANCSYGYISVTPKGLTVYLKEDITKPYAGQSGDISLTGGEAIGGVDGDLFNANDFAIVFDGEVVDAGEYAFTVVIKNEEAAKNYEVQTDGANILTVTRSELIVTLKNYSKEYTGEAHTVPADAITVGAENNHDGIEAAQLEIDGAAEMLNVGKYTYGVKITDENIARNYKVEATGSYEIVKATVTVTLRNYEKTYNGTAYTIDVQNAILSVTDSKGNESGLLDSGDFKIQYNQELRLVNHYREVLADGEVAEKTETDGATGIKYKVLTDDIYTYGVRFENSANNKNFNIVIAEGTGTFKINKRLLTFTASPLHIGASDYEFGGYADYTELEVTECISVSMNTTLADGDQLHIIYAVAQKEYSDTTFYLYSLDEYTLTNEDCYEFTNVNGSTPLSVQLVIG